MSRAASIVPLPRMSRAQRREVVRHSSETLQAVADQAAMHVFNTMVNEQMPPDLRLRAAFDILDRTSGKSVNKVDQRVLDETEERRTADLSQVPTEELHRILGELTALSSPLDQVEDAEVISDSSGGPGTSDSSGGPGTDEPPAFDLELG